MNEADTNNTRNPIADIIAQLNALRQTLWLGQIRLFGFCVSITLILLVNVLFPGIITMTKIVQR